ncbi:NAD(P)H-dependent oxidoreductase [Clostridiaceae bacterium HSG29]|nr:NAD(P)H-dependent oxidoreductase [Clostridiaceae bacterium HSG29]
MRKIKILVFNENDVLRNMINTFSNESECEIIYDDYYENISFSDEKLVLAFSTDSIGSNINLMKFIKRLKDNKVFFNNSYGTLLVNSESDLYSKTLSQQVVFLMNQMGLTFIGQPMIETIKDYLNYETWQKVYTDKTLKEICEIQIMNLARKFNDFKRNKIKDPKILVIHASSHHTSNTLMLWNMIKGHLKGYTINEIEIEDGQVTDCNGCPFEMCLHFAEKNSCYYGGVILEDILPAIENSDYIVWICPNYNDSISAKLMAVINRMTVLYRRVSLNEKTIFSVIISGNSGSDSVAKQLISSLNLNKGMILAPEFAIMEIANDSGKIVEVAGVEERATDFANKIKRY